MNIPDLFLLAINLTRRCNLACAHCYMDAGARAAGGTDELTTAEVAGLLDQIATRGSDTMVVLTGGEPLLRQDLRDLVAHGSGLGLAMVVGTNGVLLDDRRADALKAAGAMGVGISLDSLDPARHDTFRGCPGSWERTLAGMDACRRAGLPFQVHFSVTEDTAHEIPDLIAFARAAGAHVLNCFFLVCTGRGESMSDISPASYERVLTLLAQAQGLRRDLLIRARCAPHFKRVAYQLDPASPLTRAQGYDGGGCLAGIHYARVTPEGDLTACPYIPDVEGNIRQSPFWDLWESSPTFARLRVPDLQGKCGACAFRVLCGGCRARPLALGGGLMDADPWCDYQPDGSPLIEPLAPRAQGDIAWTPEAEQRLARVPGFLRKMVRKRAEDHVLGLGETQVTPDHLAALAQRRFGNSDFTPAGRQIDSPPSPLGRGGAGEVRGDGTSGEPTQPGPETQATPGPDTPPPLPWTAEAQCHLETLPAFLREGVRQVAEDLAGAEGRLEVNMRLLTRLEQEDEPGRRLAWTPEADAALEQALAARPPEVGLFLRGTLEASAEAEARRRRSPRVEAADLDRFAGLDLAGVVWSPEALARVRTAPEFIRGGIKKAAEFNARREGIAVISSADLTRFRNRAMMRAVRRMKGLGLTELSFDAYAVARERVPRLKDNNQGAKRFTAIRDYVESHQDPEGGGLGTLDRELIDKMKAELRKP